MAFDVLKRFQQGRQMAKRGRAVVRAADEYLSEDAEYDAEHEMAAEMAHAGHTDGGYAETVRNKAAEFAEYYAKTTPGRYDAAGLLSNFLGPVGIPAQMYFDAKSREAQEEYQAGQLLKRRRRLARLVERQTGEASGANLLELRRRANPYLEDRSQQAFFKGAKSSTAMGVGSGIGHKMLGMPGGLIGGVASSFAYEHFNPDEDVFIEMADILLEQEEHGHAPGAAERQLAFAANASDEAQQRIAEELRHALLADLTDSHAYEALSAAKPELLERLHAIEAGEAISLPFALEYYQAKQSLGLAADSLQEALHGPVDDVLRCEFGFAAGQAEGRSMGQVFSRPGYALSAAECLTGCPESLYRERAQAVQFSEAARGFKNGGVCLADTGYGHDEAGLPASRPYIAAPLPARETGHYQAA